MSHRKMRRSSFVQPGRVYAAIAAIVVIAGMAAYLARPSARHDAATKTRQHSSTPTPSPSTSATSPAATTGQGPAARLIPTSGAYLGAYIQPSLYTPSGEIAAVRSFQQAVGHPVELVHTYHAWSSPFPDAADRYVVRSGKVLLLTWSGTPDTRKIIAGTYDSVIAARARAVKRLGRPILLEFRHEMDRPNLRWAVHGPKDYIAAWDHIRAIFARVGATNVGWVWCPTGWGFRNGRAQAYYPGNSEVDWVCADVYTASTRQPLPVAAQPFLRWANTTNKPILIGEYGAYGAPTGMPSWLLSAGEMAKLNRQIKGMVYFDANGTDSQGRPFQDYLGGNSAALRAFHTLLTWRIFHPVLPPGG